MPRHRLARLRDAALRRSRPIAAALMIVSLTLLAGCTPVPLRSMASTGDSITRGFDACELLSDCPAVSYATGTDASSASVYLRLLGSNPQLAGHGYNHAQVGARAADLYSQMSIAAGQRADVVTVLMGANDACTDTAGKMTLVADFRKSINQALAHFFAFRPGARVVMSSIPDIFHLWQVGHVDSRARTLWQLAGICPSMLANPLSNAYGDVLRRVLVTLQLAKYNAALASVCRGYGGCRWDGGAVSRYPFSLGQLSRYDYFHPNPAGQRAIAGLAWQAYGSPK